MFVFRMPDEDFSLRKVSDEELFNAVKDEAVRVIKGFRGYENIGSEDVELNPEYTTRRDAYGRDKNFYHHMTLDVSVKIYNSYDSFILFFSPFEVKVFPRKYDPEVVEDEELTKYFTKFMAERFPESSYLEKRERYFENARIIQKVEEETLFF